MTTVIDKDLGWKEIQRAIRDAAGRYVTVGVHGSESSRGGEIDNVSLAMIHEFGSSFMHPGGTPYKIINGNVTFVKRGTQGISGYTKPHQITIPERSFIRSAFDKNVNKYFKIMKTGAFKMAGAETTANQVLAKLGEISTADTINLINAGISPGLSASTIKRKGSSKPLIDTGQLKGSIKPKLGRK